MAVAAEVENEFVARRHEKNPDYWLQADITGVIVKTEGEGMVNWRVRCRGSIAGAENDPDPPPEPCAEILQKAAEVLLQKVGK
jgi:hypothetical protein